jgi:hypothetical protein
MRLCNTTPTERTMDNLLDKFDGTRSKFQKVQIEVGPYYLQSIQHKFEVQFCSIALLCSFCVHFFIFYHNKNLLIFWFAHFIFLFIVFSDFILVYVTNKIWPKCNHYTLHVIINHCNYFKTNLQLHVIINHCNYFKTNLQLFLVLVIFVITLQLICHYFNFHLSMWTTFNLIFIRKK